MSIRGGTEADIPQIVQLMRDFERWLCSLDGSEFSSMLKIDNA